ncbi:MAG: transposase [Thaumarchaeota archaeon]|nr:transposase [Nitrososphaerota archaeon]
MVELLCPALSFASYMADDCEAKVRAYARRRRRDPNARRPRCTNPVLRQGAGSCVIYGRGFWCRLSEAPDRPILESPYVVLRFPVTPSRHVAEFRLSPHIIQKLACAVRVGAVTVTRTTLSIAYEPRPVASTRPRGIIGMDVNKREHTTADTDGSVRYIGNAALGYAQERRKKHRALGVTGGKPKQKRRKARATPRHVKHPGRKPKNKQRLPRKKRRDERVNRRERARINTRFRNKKTNYLYNLMHALAACGMMLALEQPTIDRLLVRRNRKMSGAERDLLKMGLSQGTITRTAREVFAKYGLPVCDVDPFGTSSRCPACDSRLWAPEYNTGAWKLWRRTKACIPCLYYADRDGVAAINILCRCCESAYEPAAGPGEPHCDDPGRRVAGDWEQRAQQKQQLVQTLLLGAAAVRFPHVGEGQRPKGSAKNPSYHTVGDARLLDDRPDASNGSNGVGPPGACLLGGIC